MRRTILTLCALLAICCSPAPAQKTFVVLDIAGARSPNLRDAVVESVDAGYELLPAREYRRTATRLKARRMRDRDVRRVSARLGVDYVLHGKVVNRGRDRRVLRLHVRDGDTGRRLATFVVPVRKRDISSNNRARLERKLARTFERADDRAAARERRDAARQARTARAEQDRQQSRRDRERRRDQARKRARASQQRRANERAARRAARTRIADQRAERKRASRERAKERRLAKRERAQRRRIAQQEREAKRKRRARDARMARRAAPTKRRKQRRLNQDDDDVDDYVLDDEGQAIDDEVPDAIR